MERAGNPRDSRWIPTIPHFAPLDRHSRARGCGVNPQFHESLLPRGFAGVAACGAPSGGARGAPSPSPIADCFRSAEISGSVLVPRNISRGAPGHPSAPFEISRPMERMTRRARPTCEVRGQDAGFFRRARPPDREARSRGARSRRCSRASRTDIPGSPRAQTPLATLPRRKSRQRDSSSAPLALAWDRRATPRDEGAGSPGPRRWCWRRRCLGSRRECPRR